MFQTFVSSHVTRWGTARLGVASFSVLAHASLITFAVLESGRRASDFGRLPSVVAPTEQLQFVNVREVVSSGTLARKGALAHVANKAARLLVPDLTRLHVLVDPSMAALPKVAEVSTDEDYSHTVSASDFGNVDSKQLVEGGEVYALTHPGPNGAYTAEVVEKTVWPRQDNPRPQYPDALRRAGVEGSFVVEFVVDSTGRVDPKTLAFPKSTHPAFLTAVRDALLRSRYFPAELAGMRVRQLVSQQFTFIIAR